MPPWPALNYSQEAEKDVLEKGLHVAVPHRATTLWLTTTYKYAYNIIWLVGIHSAVS